MEKVYITENGSKIKLRAENLPSVNNLNKDLFVFLSELEKGVDFRSYEFSNDEDEYIVNAFELFSCVFWGMDFNQREKLEILRDENKNIFLKFKDNIKQFEKDKKYKWEKVLKELKKMF
ncbi:hypothetical protein OR059_001702 [Campylobacter jejuni]|nr:hypothetical protein [Campylobacter jejuni]EKD4926262.1 hypothetical protein [Campylobacter jejuni]